MPAASMMARPSLSAERRFYLSTAAVGTLITFWGFAPSWFLMRWYDAPSLPWIVHIHGAIYTCWVLVYLTQTWLIAANRRDLHKQLGLASLAFGVAMVILGVAVAIDGARRGVGPPDRDHLAFMINPLGNVVMFALLLAAAVHQRKRAPYHKRLMLLTMLPILTTPLARISRMSELPVPPPVGGILISNLFLVALVAFDLKTRGKVHPATAWGGGILIASEVLRLLLGPTQAWRSFAALLIS